MLGFGFIAITTLVNAIVILVAGRFVAAAKRNPRALRLFDYGFAALMSAFARAPRLERGEIGAPSWTLPPSAPRFRPPSRPPGLSAALRALWLDARGDWDGAHDAAQADEGGAGDWVHAYLHRKEGDAGNAAYWYRRARKPVCRASLDEEWAGIASALLSEGG